MHTHGDQAKNIPPPFRILSTFIEIESISSIVGPASIGGGKIMGNYYSGAMRNSIFLAHHGILGQKWGDTAVSKSRWHANGSRKRALLFRLRAKKICQDHGGGEAYWEGLW